MRLSMAPRHVIVASGKRLLATKGDQIHLGLMQYAIGDSAWLVPFGQHLYSFLLIGFSGRP
jgi:predicted small integral membrane protein